MAQHINKDALVAEMERRISNLEQLGDRQFIATHFPEQFRFIEVYEGIIDFINTLEVKEVDSLTPEEIKKICTIYDNLKQERECASVLYNSDETFFNHVLMEYKSIAQKGE